MNKTINKFLKHVAVILPLIIVLDIPFIVYAFKSGVAEMYLAVIISILIPLLIQITLQLKLWQFVLLSLPVLYLSLSFDTLIFDFNSYYNISTWAAVFDTNPEESKEFFKILTRQTWLTGILQISTYLFYLLLSLKIQLKKQPVSIRITALIILLLLTINWFMNGITAQAYPFGHTLHSYIAYRKQSDLEKKLYLQKKSYRYNAYENSEFATDSLPKTIVVLINESLRRDHQQIYGYQRKTTPLIAKENLIIYTDLISPANQTVNALRRIFSQAEGTNDTLYFAKPSIITAFKEAGYHTAWFSTQPVGKNGESKNSVIAKESDTTIFRNNNQLDTILLKDLAGELKIKNRKKLIFLHTFGVHYLYEKRFPKNFAHFSKTTDSDYKQDQINKYDDAIRYNDLLQSKIIKLLKQQKGEKIFIAFSDHGESLFDSGPNIQGHGALHPAKSEYDIPFIIWLSDEYKNKHPDIYAQVIKNKDLPAINSDFFYSFPYLSGIEFNELNPAKNFFKNSYKHRQNLQVINSALELLDYNRMPAKRK